MTTTAEFLAMSAVNRRAESVRYEIIDASQIGTTDRLGVLELSTDEPPTLRFDATRPIQRTLGSILTADDVDELHDLVRVVWTFGNGAEFTWGVFMFGDASRLPYSDHTDLDGELVDRLAILDEEMDAAWSAPAGTDAVEAAVSLAQDVGFDPIVDAPGMALAAPPAYPANTKRLQIITDLLATCACYAPHTNNDGQLVYRSVPVLSIAEPDHDYDQGSGDTDGVVVEASVVESNSLLTAPNRFRAIESGISDDDTPIVGTFDIPDEAPHSFLNIGRRRTRTESFQGLPDQAAADDAARAMEAQDPGAYEYRRFVTIPVPTHGAFGVVAWRDVNYRELGWSLVAEAGAGMSHDLRRVYSEVT